MDKTININLGGTLFTIDEDAYHILRNYLDTIDRKFRNFPGGNETIEDIEYRIAELFHTQSGIAGVIIKANVEYVISVIGKPEDFDQEEAGSPSVNEIPPHRRKMYRNPDNTIIGGVCGGIGTYLSTDPVWIRILFVIFAFFFGVGFFVYLALWIALPSADTESQMKEMYGSKYYKPESWKTGEYPYHTTSKAGNAFNAMFTAFGKVLFVIARIFLIFFGVCLVLTGFLTLLAFIMIFIFKYPGAFSTDISGINLSYVPDLLRYIVSPGSVPYIKVLISLVVAIPCLMIIYGGIRMIFWFRARDGFVWLTGLIVWVLSVAALAILFFNEGVSYAQMADSTTLDYFKSVPDTLYIVSDKKMSGVITDKEIILPDELYNIYISDENKELYTKTRLYINSSEDKKVSIEIKKRSAGRNRLNAIERAERLKYNYSISKDTLYLDEYFTIPAETRWSFDKVSVRVYAPEGTVIYMDKITETQFNSTGNDYRSRDSRSRFWKIDSEGLENVESGVNNKEK